MVTPATEHSLNTVRPTGSSSWNRVAARSHSLLSSKTLTYPRDISRLPLIAAGGRRHLRLDSPAHRRNTLGVTVARRRIGRRSELLYVRVFSSAGVRGERGSGQGWAR